jgi:hypothetical protein
VRIVWLFVVATSACSFDPAVVGIDARIDTTAPPDQDLSYSIDSVSHKAVPANKFEWAHLIAARGLSIVPPSGVWLMQEQSGMLMDSVGGAALRPQGAPKYQLFVNGWQRVAVQTDDSAGGFFADAPDVNLPNLQTTSMTVMIYYSNLVQPSGARTIMILGAGNPQNFGKVTIDAASHLQLIAGGTSSSGSKSYDLTVTPIIAKLDNTHTLQVLYTPIETIAVNPYTALVAGPRGLFIGGGDGAQPAGAWLYMAAWYGSGAEMADTDVSKLFTALGF